MSLSLALFCAVAFALPAGAQAREGIRFGRVVCAVPDQDGDGLEDFVVTEEDGPDDAHRSGTVYIFSSAGPSLLARHRDGWPGALGGRVECIRRGEEGSALLLERDYGAGSFVSTIDAVCVRSFGPQCGAVCSVGDWDDDGYDDLAAEQDERIVVLSGHSFEPIRELPASCAPPLLGTPGDLDGDGRGELVVGGGLEPFAARVVFTRIESHVLQFEMPKPARPRDGSATRWVIESAGDFDGDSRQDLAVGWPWCGNGWAAVYSGEDGRALFELTPSDSDSPSEHRTSDCGESLLGGEDVNADGLDDLIVAAPDGFLAPALLRAYACGATEPLWSIEEWDRAGEPSYLGISLCFVPDRDGDGVREVLAAGTDPYDHGGVFHSGHIRILSGATGIELWSFHETELRAFDREPAK